MSATTMTTNDIATINGTHGDATIKMPTFPPPKTDKPRPHVCTTCGRSFARLEHLKRHERSHTKEKPFECPQCTRCFARRDLLLRHQQKLHQTGNTSSRPRGRRESASGAQTTAKARKNSIASTAGGVNGNNNNASMRPRANTISHIDMAAFNSMMANHRANGYHGHHPSLNAYNGINSYDFRAMSTFGHHGNMHNLLKLDTNGLNNINLSGGLRTAPILNDGFDFDKLFGGGSTINPAQLHFPGASGPLSAFEGLHFAPTIEDEDALDWTGALGESLMDVHGEAVGDGSSPSAISTASHSGFSEVMLDGSNHALHSSGSLWNSSMLAATNMAQSSPFDVDPVSAAIFPELVGHHVNMMPSTELRDHHMTSNFLFSSGQNMQGLNTTAGIPGMPNQYFQNHLAFDSGVGSPSAVNGLSLHAGCKTNPTATISTASITDVLRQALLFSLSQPSLYGHARNSSASPISSGFNSRTSPPAASLPSTQDLRRYVAAYMNYFHPHMPFLHIPTLTFDTPAFTSNLRASHKEGIVGGGGCLVLAMAAIGASYEFEHKIGRELFESSKRMIKLYLDERCIGLKTSMGMSNSQHRTPTWLVQAMLLNLIYGHQCGDKVAAESATIQCAALVSLAKAAELDKPDVDNADDEEYSYKMRNPSEDIEMSEETSSPSRPHRAGSPESREDYAQWFRWKSQEERKRTLYSVFILSSLLVTAYNHQPRILNSELHLELPCEEDLWAADDVRTWQALGGLALATAPRITFADALTYLLTASQRTTADRRRHSVHQPFGSGIPLEDVPESELKPSTFGSYVLINALHVYIWETRQRHHGRPWKPQETEQMHAHIEPALRAWQSAWKSNPHHSLDRPNPYGPLPADSIPLLDLAYVRLFVNLGRSKEAFWNRDFEQMAKELGEGSDIVQNPGPSRSGSSEPNNIAKVEAGTAQQSPSSTGALAEGSGDLAGVLASSTKVPGQSTKRERHLRKAAFYAADSLAMADRLGVTFAEFTSRELPIQSAICTFDCVQVLAEWVATVQERVGRFLGIIGRDDIDYGQVPAIMLLEEEDVKLIRKISEILSHAEIKVAFDAASMGTSPEAMHGSLAGMKDNGHGSKILLITSYMLNKAAVWGITKVMSNALHIHAEALKRRAEASLEA